MNQSEKSHSNRYRGYSIHAITARCLTAFTLFLAVFLIQSSVNAAETPDDVQPALGVAAHADYFFPLSGFPDCSIKSSRVYRASYSGIAAIGYVEYLEGQPYLNGYELLPDPNQSPEEIYTELSSKFSESYGEPAVNIELAAYPEPDNRLQIWFNEESSTRVFLNLAGENNQKRCYIAFVDYK